MGLKEQTLEYDNDTLIIVTCFREKSGYYSGRFFFETFSVHSIIGGIEYDVTEILTSEHLESLKSWVVDQLEAELREEETA